ncbi:MAG: putative lipid II flippase FtsW [Pseudomonadota bacterium]
MNQRASSFSIPLPVRFTPLRIDSVLLLMSVALLAIGLVMLASSSIGIAEGNHGEPLFFLKRQLQALVIGFAGAGFMLLVPTDVWENTGPILLLFGLCLLGLVLLPGVGTTVNGSTRWVKIAGIGVQVSEPARLALILYIAGYALRQQASLRSQFSGLLKPMIVLSFAAMLLLMEPDFGAATVLLATTMIMLFVAGARVRDFAVISCAGIAAFIALALTSDYRKRRLMGFLDPWADPYDTGFQLTQSHIAIGRGEWFGVGLGDSVQKLFYLPEAHTDFVFAVFAEEFGLLGVTLLVGLFLFFVLRILRLAKLAAENGQWFQAYVALGIGVWLGLQAFINIGVNAGLLPTKGLTLPLISYGRSSIIIVMTAIGLLLRIHHEVSGSAAPPSVRKGKRS